jgi:CheY-like chemotaxis protein
MNRPRPNTGVPPATIEQIVDAVWEEATRRPTVVIAIAEEGLRNAIRGTLLRSLFTVIEPPAGELPTEMAGMFPPDAVVVDVRDPRDNGWMTVRRLRDDPRTEAVGVVALVSQPEEADLWWARRLRVGRLLPVPWEGDELLCAVEGVMVT